MKILLLQPSLINFVLDPVRIVGLRHLTAHLYLHFFRRIKRRPLTSHSSSKGVQSAVPPLFAVPSFPYLTSCMADSLVAASRIRKSKSCNGDQPETPTENARRHAGRPRRWAFRFRSHVPHPALKRPYSRWGILSDSRQSAYSSPSSPFILVNSYTIMNALPFVKTRAKNSNCIL